MVKAKREHKPTVSTKSLKPFQDRLRELYYKMTYMTRSIHSGVTQHYERNVPSCGVRVEVQLWVKPDGTHAHRVSHYHKHRFMHEGKLVEHDDGGVPGHMDTVPVTFTTVVGMEEAINFETDRDINRLQTAKEFTKDFG